MPAYVLPPLTYVSPTRTYAPRRLMRSAKNQAKITSSALFHGDFHVLGWSNKSVQVKTKWLKEPQYPKVQFALNVADLLTSPNKMDKNTLLWAQYPSQSPPLQLTGLRKPKTLRERALEGQNILIHTTAPDTNPKKTRARHR